MTFSQYAGTAIVPTLSRLVLCLAFASTGYNKLFKDAEYSLEEATRLQQLGITAVLKTTRAQAEPGGADWRVTTAALRQESPPPSPAAPSQPPETVPPPPPAAEPAPAAAPTVPSTAPSAPSVAGALSPGVYKAAGMYQIALMVDKMRWPYPAWEARLAAITEFVGGLLLLVGLFSRVWGLGLATVMGVAFYLTVLPALQSVSYCPAHLKLSDFGTLFTQASLFVLAFGILLTGAGPLSLDRLLFSRPAPPLPQSQNMRRLD